MEAIKFTPHDDETLNRFECKLSEGKGTAVVTAEKFGNNGKPWMLLIFDVIDQFGEKGSISYFFSLDSKELLPYKRFCEAANRPDIYAKGEVIEGERIGLTTSVDLRWQKFGKYPGMKIKEFIRNEDAAKVMKDFYSSEQKKKQEAISELPDEDIPF